MGERIFPFRLAGDKNFWLDMIVGLRRLGHDVETLSVDVEDVPTNDLSIRHVPQIPVYFRPDARFNEGYRRIAGTNNYASKTVSLPILFRELRRQRREFRPEVIHFADNFGPAMAGVRAITGDVPLTVSAPTYQRNRPLYDVMLLASFSRFNVVVPFSDAYRRRLFELRMHPSRIRRIRWGIDVARFTLPSPAEREAVRARLGLHPESFVVLWTGFTQQTGEADLHSALRTATLALRRGSFEFVFCFKPEHFKDSYRAFERPSLRIVGNADLFHAARTAADVFLSPIQDTRSTAAPPLVWPETLAMGIPILTTNIPGTDEAVVDGQSGFTVRSPEEAAGRLTEIASDPALGQRLRDGARRIAVERFSVDRALDEHLEMWSALVDQSR